MKKHTALTYGIYNYLMNNNVGIDNAISNSNLANNFSVSDRTVRAVINEINNTASLDDFSKFVCNSNNGYWIATEQDYKISLSREWKAVISRLKRLKAITRKISLDNQIKLQLDKYNTELVESFGVKILEGV